MIKRALVKTLLIIFIIFFSIPSFGSQIEVTDFRDKKIVLQKPAKTIVCLIESALTNLYMLKQKDKIIGIPNNVYEEGFFYSETYKYYSKLDENIKNKKIPTVGNWEKANIEKIVSLKPDIVIIWSQQVDAINNLERLNIPVYGVFITGVDDIYKELRDLGKITGSEKRAEELISYIKKEINRIKRLTNSAANKRKVYFSWAQHGLLNTACRKSIVNEVIELSGGKNVCEIDSESINIDLERLLKFNPDVIMLWYSYGFKPHDVIQNHQLQNIKAVKEKRVYQLPETFLFDLWTPKFINAIVIFAKSLYPENLNSLDVRKAIANNLKFMYGMELER